MSQQLVKKVHIVSWCLVSLLFFLEAAWQAEMWWVSSCCERCVGLPLQHLTMQQILQKITRTCYMHKSPHTRKVHARRGHVCVKGLQNEITSFIDHHGKVLFPGRLTDGISCTTAPLEGTLQQGRTSRPAKFLLINPYAYNNPCPLVPHELWLMSSSTSLPIKVSLPLLEISVSYHSRSGRLLWSWLVLLVDIFLNDCNMFHVSVGTYCIQEEKVYILIMK